MIRFLLDRLPLALAAALALAAPARAENTLSFLAGQTFRNTTDSRDFAFLRWRGEPPAAATVHVKPGGIANATAFNIAGRIAPQTSPAVIATLAGSMPAAIFDATEFTAIIDGFFGEFIPAFDLTLADKVAMLILLGNDDPRVKQRLEALAVAEPFLAVCMGLAAVVPMPAASATFELRAGTPESVIARVTLNATTGPALPSPPAPVHLFESGAFGHLNVKLRWEPSPAVLRATPRSFGYDVYRIERAFAESLDFHLQPPDPAALAVLLSDMPNLVKRVNEGAILIPAGTDPQTPFIADDNGARFGDGPPFNDGDAFYYHTALRDLLGNPGPLSPGTLVTICNRQPPESPRRVTVENYRISTGGAPNLNQTRLRVSWRPHPSAATNPPRAYRVSRWANVSDIAGGTPLYTAFDIPHIPDQLVYHSIDRFGGAPSTAAGRDTTFWYSVEAIQTTACGDLTSGPSAPGFGALRDFTGPSTATDGTVHASSSRLGLSVTNLGDVALTEQTEGNFSGPTGDVRYISLFVARGNSTVKSFSLGISRTLPNNNVAAETLATVFFADATPSDTINRRIPHALFQEDPAAYLWIRAKDSTGREAYAQVPLSTLNTEQLRARLLVATITLETNDQSITSTTPAPVGFFHQPFFPVNGALNPIELSFLPSAAAKEYKLYKTIDAGPRIFIAQGPANETPGTLVEVSDSAFPPYGGRLCYFVQTFNEHGDPSPLAQLGCIDVAAKSPMPVPVLERATAAGTTENPQVRLRWFCPPDGVERFHIFVGDSLTPVRVGQPALNTPRRPFFTFTGVGAPTVLLGVAPGVMIDGIQYKPYETGRVAGDLGNPATPGQFEVLLNVAPGREYRFFINSLSATGDASAPSNIELFNWQTPAETPPALVPWPARALPALDQNFLPQLTAAVITEPSRFSGVGIRIGDFHLTVGNTNFGTLNSDNGVISSTPPSYDEFRSNTVTLYTTATGETVFPCVVYRYEADPATGDAVTGDIVQVTPMIDGLWERTDKGAVRVTLHQPHIGLFGNEQSTGGVFIKDTQPVIAGSTYRYLIVRFRENGEIDRVLPVPAIKVPN